MITLPGTAEKYGRDVPATVRARILTRIYLGADRTQPTNLTRNAAHKFEPDWARRAATRPRRSSVAARRCPYGPDPGRDEATVDELDEVAANCETV